MKELMVDKFEPPIGTIVSVVFESTLIHLDFTDCQAGLLRLRTHCYKQFKQASCEKPTQNS